MTRWDRRRARRVAKDTQLAPPRAAAAQRHEPISRAECRPHRVLDNGEPAQRPASQGMAAAHFLRVG